MGPRDRRAHVTSGDLSRIGVKDRRDDEPRTGAPHLVPAALALCVAVACWVFWGRLSSCGASLDTPETQIRKALAAQTRAQVPDVYGFRAGGTLELTSLRFEDVAPLVERDRAVVVAMLTAQGRAAWRDQAASVSYVGRERFHMKPCSIVLWCGEGDQFDGLRGVLLALFRRLDAVQAGDAQAYARLLSEGYQDLGEDRARAERRLSGEASRGPAPVRVAGWQIRVEREHAEVGEDLETSAAGGEALRQRRVYRLRREGSRWLFVGGV